MEQLLVWLWDTSYGLRFDLATIVLCLVAIGFIYTRNQLFLLNLFKSSPTALLLVDSKTGKLRLANASANQVLGVRKVGKNYMLPETITAKFILSVLPPEPSNTFTDQQLTWPVSNSRVVKLNVTGRKIVYRRRPVWLLYFTPYLRTELELKQEIESLSTIKSAFDNLSELIFIKNNHGEIVSSNRAFQRFWQGREEEGSADIQSFIKGRASKRSWTTDPTGRGRLLESYQSILMSSQGEKIGTLGISHDVTDWHDMQQSLRDEMEKRKDTEVALAQRDTILQNILESSPDSIGIFNENMVYQACNLPFVKALGISEVEDLIGKRLQDVIPDDIYKRLSVTDKKVLYEGKSLRYIDRVINSNGQCTWYDVVKSPFRDPASGTNGVLVMARDVSERYLAEQKLEEANQELEKLSFIDGLTQISNRRRFDEQLETLWFLHVREEQPLTVMLCDIDYFKDYNDCYGHQRGDEALVKVASVFQEVITRSSDCVARYGGEEFGFLLPNTTAEGALLIAEKVHAGVKELGIEHKASKASQQVTVSIGLVSIVPQRLDHSETIVALADSALYQAKANGRNQTCVHHTSDN